MYGLNWACVCVYVVYMLVYFFFHFISYYTNAIFFTSSTRRRGICRKLSNNFSLTCVCKSGKHSLMLRKTSLFNCEHIEPFIHESFDVPSLLCSHSDVSLSLTFAIFTYTWIHTRRTYNLARLTLNHTIAPQYLINIRFYFSFRRKTHKKNPWKIVMEATTEKSVATSLI